jgi:hypothetical protein
MALRGNLAVFLAGWGSAMSDKLKMVRLRGGRMTKWRGKAASVAPGMLSASVLALTAGLASAQGAPTTIDSPVFIQQTVSVDEDVTITADGSVTLVVSRKWWKFEGGVISG